MDAIDVSIIILTRNAGSNFELLLERIFSHGCDSPEHSKLYRAAEREYQRPYRNKRAK